MLPCCGYYYSSFCKIAVLLLLSSVACTARMSAAFITPITKCRVKQHSYRSKLARVSPLLANNNSDDEENNSLQRNQNNGNENIENKIDAFLDKPIFDPDSESNQDNWFANLVKNDYDSAEALYVGVVVIVGVIVSQELLRIVKYGGNYFPFGGGGGNLF